MIGADSFQAGTNVSRETLAKLSVYAGLLKKWTPSINLVAKSTLPALWGRHFLDSAQLLDLADIKSGHWVDIGSGGGFPGLVIAIIAEEKAPDLRVSLVESDTRKATFLRTVIRELSLQAVVHAKRIEEITPLQADTLSARALAPLSDLLGFSERHLKADGTALFMKGASFRRDLNEALESWSFQSHECPSITDAESVILKLGDIKRV